MDRQATKAASQKEEEMITEGVRIRTNEAFVHLVDEPMLRNTLPWEGVAVKRHNGALAVWVVKFDNIPANQFIHEEYLEVI